MTGTATLTNMQNRETPRAASYERSRVGDAVALHVAYLINIYPSASMTFIRREIVALEELGVKVCRVAIRRGKDVVDHADLNEEAATTYLFDQGFGRIFSASWRLLCVDPMRFLKTLWFAIRIGAGSDRGVLRHIAYFVEACVLRALLPDNIRCVHAHFGTNSATVAMLCRMLGGPKFSFTVHGTATFERPRANRLEEKIRRAESVVAVSRDGRQRLTDVASNCTHKYHVIRCGLDEELLLQPPVGISPNAPIVCVARLSEEKGHRHLLEAASELKRRGRDFQLELVGDGPLRSQIEADIVVRGLQSVVRLAGWQDEAGVKRSMMAAQAVVLPSLGEGLPVVLMEALALRRPCVATNVGGVSELVVEGENGWLVEPGDAIALADALSEVLETPNEQLFAMGDAGRQRVLEEHDIQANIQRLKDLFSDS